MRRDVMSDSTRRGSMVSRTILDRLSADDRHALDAVKNRLARSGSTLSSWLTDGLSAADRQSFEVSQDRLLRNGLSASQPKRIELALNSLLQAAREHGETERHPFIDHVRRIYQLWEKFRNGSGDKLDDHKLKQEHFKKLLDSYTGANDTPEGKGWLRLCMLLHSASLDPVVVASKPAADFLETMCWLAGEAVKAADVEAALQPLVSAQAADRAKARHSKTTEPKAWVLAQWSKHAVDYSGNKSAFAEDYSRLVLKQFDLAVRARTIREDWLKGA